ncbi:MAG: ABC-2 transporter permease, partial [Lachnospiraceae bacterium]|nr:ABC-2 transporter permease [Lachnospiraceae bacterium]
YLAEKYLISIGGGVVGLLVGLLVVGFGVLTGTQINHGEFFAYMAVGVLVAVVMVSLMIPLEIKFGAEQSRTAMFAVIAGVFIAAVVIAKILPEAIVARIVVFLMHLSQAQLVAGLVGICVVLVAISVFLSGLFIKKKEF